MRRQALPIDAAIALALALAAGTPAGAGEDLPFERSERREPCAEFAPQRRPFFGDLHVHTAFSQDARTQDTRTTPREAYAFARGEPLGIQPWDARDRPLRTARLERPIDFAAVTDHAEQLGEVRLCTTPGAPGFESLVCRLFRSWPRAAFYWMNWVATSGGSRHRFCGPDGVFCLQSAWTVWNEIRAAAEAAYDRSAACRFTSFVGYEWTASRGIGQNLHRNVIFRNDRVPGLPTSVFEADAPADLWEALETQCLEGIPGCDAIAIPHNANLSGGLMFTSAVETGAAIGPEEAARRARFEPLVEVMQHKGDSECLPGGADELCAFEALPYATFGAKFAGAIVGRDPPTERSTVRWALGEGLRLERELGANPFRFGLVASTDTHLGTPGLTAEWAHPGHGGAGAGAGSEDGLEPGLPDDIELGPGGLAVVWAEENSRDALFAALERRETYGTSGTRPVVRFFGGWDYPDDLCERPDLAARGYAGGVPMGGVLPAPPGASGPTGGGAPRPPGGGAPAPRLAVSARMDPGSEDHPGTPLERIQIVKGWLEDGAVRERVVDVAVGEDPASVDPATCETRDGGAPLLCRVWEDPDFDPAAPAFYYARVVESPTCRWSQRLCVAAGVVCEAPETIAPGFEPCCDPIHRPVIRERAWTSPIWYAPGEPGP